MNQPRHYHGHFMKLNSTPELTYTHNLNEVVSPQRSSLITKAQNRGLDAFIAEDSDARHARSSRATAAVDRSVRHVPRPTRSELRLRGKFVR